MAQVIFDNDSGLGWSMSCFMRQMEKNLRGISPYAPPAPGSFRFGGTCLFIPPWFVPMMRSIDELCQWTKEHAVLYSGNILHGCCGEIGNLEMVWASSSARVWRIGFRSWLLWEWCVDLGRMCKAEQGFEAWKVIEQGYHYKEHQVKITNKTHRLLSPPAEKTKSSKITSRKIIATQVFTKKRSNRYVDILFYQHSAPLCSITANSEPSLFFNKLAWKLPDLLS